MNRIVGAFLALAFAAFAMPAWADSLPKSGLVPIGEVAAASTNWSGFYVGAHGGYLWGDWDASVREICVVFPLAPAFLGIRLHDVRTVFLHCKNIGGKK